MKRHVAAWPVQNWTNAQFRVQQAQSSQCDFAPCIVEGMEDFTQDVEDDARASEAGHKERGYEAAGGGKEVGYMEICEVICDASEANDDDSGIQGIEVMRIGQAQQDEAQHVEQHPYICSQPRLKHP